jgi:hypothetical protein
MCVAALVVALLGHVRLSAEDREEPPRADPVLTVRVPETLIQQVRPGLACQVRIDALPGRVFKGKVKSEPDVKAYRAKVQITDPVEGLNLNGLSGELTLGS